MSIILLKDIEQIAAQEDFLLDDLKKAIREIFLTHKYTGIEKAPSKVGGALYRSVVIKSGEKIPQLLKRISYPPTNKTLLNRANLSEKPVFYCSGYPNATFFEIEIQPGDKVILSTWKIIEPITLIPLGYTQKIFNELNSNRNLPYFMQVIKDNLVYNSIDTEIHEFFCTKFTRPGNKNSYRITAAIADIFYGERDCGIIYPAMQVSANEDNIALTTSIVDKKKIQITEAILLKVSEKKYYGPHGVNLHTANLMPINYADSFSSEGEIMWKGHIPQNQNTIFSFISYSINNKKSLF